MIAEKWDISREDMEDFALESHRRAVQAIDEGRFEREIAPLGGVTVDEGPRREPDTREDGEPASRCVEGGRVTAAVASQISDAVGRHAHRVGGGGEGPRPRRRGPASTTSRCAATTRSAC